MHQNKHSQHRQAGDQIICGRYDHNAAVDRHTRPNSLFYSNDSRLIIDFGKFSWCLPPLVSITKECQPATAELQNKQGTSAPYMSDADKNTKENKNL